MLLFTGDRDMYQLATENVKIVSTKKGVSDVAIMTHTMRRSSSPARF